MIKIGSLVSSDFSNGNIASLTPMTPMMMMTPMTHDHDDPHDDYVLQYSAQLENPYD
jgi:hypothetical protein